MALFDQAQNTTPAAEPGVKNGAIRNSALQSRIAELLRLFSGLVYRVARTPYEL
jgi:hypothetical protein